MNFNEEELNDFNQSTDHFMGKEWGRREYSSIDEVKVKTGLVVNTQPYRPFKMLSKRNLNPMFFPNFSCGTYLPRRVHRSSRSFRKDGILFWSTQRLPRPEISSPM